MKYATALALTASIVAANNVEVITDDFKCVDPQVTTCFKAKKADCYDAMVKADAQSAGALKGLPVAPGMDKLLLQGKEFQEMFKWTIQGDDVYLSVLEFERLGYLQDIQLAIATLQLEATQPGDQQ